MLDGSGLDVDFSLSSPSGHLLYSDYRKSDGVHTWVTAVTRFTGTDVSFIIFPFSFTSVETEDGDYMFCFDNSFSAVSEKLIFFELILDNMGDSPDDWKEYVHDTDVLDMKLEDIMVRMHSCWEAKSTVKSVFALLSLGVLDFDRFLVWCQVSPVPSTWPGWDSGCHLTIQAARVYIIPQEDFFFFYVLELFVLRSGLRFKSGSGDLHMVRVLDSGNLVTKNIINIIFWKAIVIHTYS